MIEYKDKTFSTLKEVADHYGIPYGTFKYRNREWGLEKAIETVYVKKESGRPRGTGEIPLDIIELAEENNISYPLLYRRYITGMDMFDAAITPPGIKPGRKTTEFTEEEMEKLAKIGLTPRLVRQRRRTGWTRHQAMNIPIGGKRK